MFTFHCLGSCWYNEVLKQRGSTFVITQGWECAVEVGNKPFILCQRKQGTQGATNAWDKEPVKTERRSKYRIKKNIETEWRERERKREKEREKEIEIQERERKKRRISTSFD